MSKFTPNSSLVHFETDVPLLIIEIQIKDKIAKLPIFSNTEPE
jgi:hypothetical protein